MFDTGAVPSAAAAAPPAPAASLDDASDGPGEPPGPGASPEEQARYRARLAAHEERKGRAWHAWVRAQAAATTKGAGHGHHGDRAEAKSPPPHGKPQAATQADGQRWRGLAQDARRAAENSGAAVGLLQDMMQPGEAESPHQARISELLTAIAERVVSIGDRLSRIESRLTGPRLVSPR